MDATFILVLALLTTESSYAQEVERPATKVPDTIQFWFAPSAHWRIRTYAIDHDIHTYTLGSLTPDEAVAHTQKHYSDIVSSLVVLTFHDPTDKEEIQQVLAEHKLTGTLEVGKSGVAFYNPDKGEYRTKSHPK